MNFQLDNQKTRSLKHSTSSSSLLSRTRKLSSELKIYRPLKRSTSLSYRTNIPKTTTINTSNSTTIKTNIPKSNSFRELPTPTSPSSSYGKRLTRRFKSLRKISTNTVSSSSTLSNISSPIFDPNINNETIISPPSSPSQSIPSPKISYNEDLIITDNEDEFDSSFSSISRDTSFNTSYSSISSCESSPIKSKALFTDYTLRQLKVTTNSDDLLTLNTYSTITSFSTSSKIFEIPEILEIILRYVSINNDEKNSIEPKMYRRPPLSYNHSLLMYGKNNGEKIWERTVSEGINYKETSGNSTLYNCLLVNKQWNYQINQILNENLIFNNDEKFEKFTSNKLHYKDNVNEIIEPISINLNKIKSPKSIYEIFENKLSSRRLEKIEYYICSNFLPSINLISNNLKKLVLPGCKILNDDNLKNLISKSPNLIHLDIRACDSITDSSIYFIANNCSKLELLNCGRHKRGELISDISIGLIAKNCPIKTIGLAGCGISDWSIWELALHCGSTLERLSINYCWKLTDVGICKVIKAKLIEKLSVLEIRGIQINNIEDLVNWRIRKLNEENFKVLIEACERIDLMINEFESKINYENNLKLMNNLTNWINNNENDNDINFRSFLNNRYIE